MGIKPNLYTYPSTIKTMLTYALAHESNLLLMYLDPKKYIHALKQKLAIFSLFSANTTTLYKNSNFVFVLPMKNSILL